MQHTSNPTLLRQIDAGIKCRQKGHSYENILALRLNNIQTPYTRISDISTVIHMGRPEIILIDKILTYLNWYSCDKITAYSTGKLATSESGDKSVLIEGENITSTKSDIILILHNSDSKIIIGVSVKQCNNKTPTNAQAFFTTATAFYDLLTSNGINLSNNALIAMRQFCGDLGFRPIDNDDCSERISSPDIYFWEEINSHGKIEWENAFIKHQDLITKLILQKGYADDPFPPQIILHKTKSSPSIEEQEIAIFDIDQFISLSRKYSSYTFKLYNVNKGRYKEPKNILHQAPRFGVIQMQRGGQKQHPSQLQFNLKSGYFYELDKL